MDQIYNLIDLVARDVYPLHFGDQSARYLGGARRLRSSVMPVRVRTRPFLEFVHRHRREIQALMGLRRIGA